MSARRYTFEKSNCQGSRTLERHGAVHQGMPTRRYDDELGTVVGVCGHYCKTDGSCNKFGEPGSSATWSVAPCKPGLSMQIYNPKDLPTE